MRRVWTMAGDFDSVAFPSLGIGGVKGVSPSPLPPVLKSRWPPGDCTLRMGLLRSQRGSEEQD